MRNKRLIKNSLASLIYQVTTIVCGFLLPRVILNAYGSAVNGLIASITQFLSVVSFLELGVGAVVQSALYKPLVEKDSVNISNIIASAENFFKRVAFMLSIYIVVLVLIYPMLVQNNFSAFFSGALILCISVSYFAQHYYGVVDRLLLTADQKGYVKFNTLTITAIANTIVCILLIYLGASIHIVKLVTSFIYLLRPIIIRRYVNKHYCIDRKIVYSGEPIKQKWNGVAQHIAAIVLDGTDSIVLTLFSTLANVSIYSVYNMVVLGVRQLFMLLISGVQAMIGELWAKQEMEELLKIFGWLEWVLHTGTVFVFGCVGMLMIPFIRVYTVGITDANYIQPLFSMLITLANAGNCLRLPYITVVLAAGHYKQTQSNYIIAVILNIVISILTVHKYGLIGVAVGTLVAMFYQTVWMAVYNSKNLIKWPLKRFGKQIFVDVITAVVAISLTLNFKLVDLNYLQWFILAVKISVVWLVIILILNFVFYRDRIRFLYSFMCRKLRRS